MKQWVMETKHQVLAPLIKQWRKNQSENYAFTSSRQALNYLYN